MSKLCVKKPYTVLVGVILVLVLGVVAFTRMTTDLLPNMDLPYMVVYTTDPGASPESVEKSVSKPLEAALGTTTGLKEIQSTSSENVSVLIMEFEQDTDMNAVSIEMSNTIDQVKGSLPENCASPVMMQITPDMMPVMVASVDVDGMETKEISDYVNDTLLNRFERIDGVASVDSSGMISSKVKVTLDQKKIDALNDKVLESVNSELADAKKQLDEGQNELNEAKKQISSGESALSDQTGSMSAQLGEASAAVDTANAQLSAILSEETTLNANQAAFQMELEQLQQFADMDSQVSILAKMIVVYDITGTVQDITKVDIDSMKESFTQLTQALKDPAAYITGMSEERYAAAIQALTAALPDQDMSQLTGVSKSDFSTLVTTTAYAATRVDEISAELNNINTRLMTISAMKPELEAALKQAQDAYAQVEAGKMQAAVAAAQGSAQLAVGKASLENAQTQLDDAKKQFEDARDEAYEKADISGIVTADMISNILVAENFEMPAGYIKDSSDNSYILKVGKEFATLDELKNVLLFSMDVGDIGDIYLTDVATVEYASESEDDSHTVVNGNPAILLSFSKQSTASTSSVSNAIAKEIEKLQAEDERVHITPLMDQGDYIDMVVDNVLSNLIFGGILAVIVLLFFLRDIRPTIVIAFSIPLSVLFAIVLMYFTNLTLNLISLSGLALGVGMLVDNSIVVIENIYRLRGQGMSAPKAAVQGAQQMGGAVFASTLTTVCVFLPIVFAQGISKQLFTDMGLTIAYSLSASLVVALTVVPAMSSMILKSDKSIKSHSRFSGIGKAYEKALRWCLSHRLISLGTVIALFLFACVSVTRMGMVFIPEMSSNQMSASLEMPDEATDTEVEALTDKAASMIQDVDGVKTVGAMTGSGGGMSMLSGGSSGNSATFYIILEDGADNAAVAKEIRDKSADIEGEMSVSESNMDMGSLTGSGVSINVYGENLDDLQKVCADLAKKLEKIDGLIDISDGNDDPDMQKVITVNKDEAMREGLTVAQVYASLAADLQNEVTSTTLTVGTEELPVVVIKPTEVTAENVMKQTITSTDAQTGESKDVSLNTIASQKDSEAPTTIKRSKNERTMTVSAGVDEEHNASLLSGQVQEMLDNYDLPEGITVETAGENETIMDAMKDLILMLILAVIFIYLIMVAQFQSLLSPFIVMFTMPLAFTGGLLALLVTGQDMSILAMLGFIILAGVVVNNGIVFVSCVNELRLDGMEKRDALVESGKMRMRPIFMTAMTTILSMSTMALGIGTGGEMGQAMAIVVIGGLTYATILTLFVVPIMYDIFNRKKKLQKIDIGEEDIV